MIALNRKAYYDYNILEVVEAGLVLKGTEIKSIREGKVNLRESYARPEGGQIWLFNMHVATYHAGSVHNHEPTRPRKLLLHKNQILQLAQQTDQKGLTLVPLKLYIKRHRAKVELGVAQGKKLYDKRRVMAEREARQETQRTLKQHRE